MGFVKTDLTNSQDGIRRQIATIHDYRNDGYIQRDCKHELYLLKCWLEDEYSKLPKFTGEELWEQERLMELLKK